MKQSEQVIVNHNPLFDDEDDDYSQHSVSRLQRKMKMKMKVFMNLQFMRFLLSLIKKTFERFNNMQKIN